MAEDEEKLTPGKAIPLTPKAAETVTFEAFGHRWVDYPAGLAEDLIDLEREGAMYSHFSDKGSERPDGTATFSYYRIPLLPDETFQYVEACLAYQEFHKALKGGAAFDEALAAISNSEIAQRVQSYGDYGHSKLKHGLGTVDLRGCHASFYPDGMEALLCGGRRSRYEALPEPEPTRDRFGLLMQILNAFPSFPDSWQSAVESGRHSRLRTSTTYKTCCSPSSDRCLKTRSKRCGPRSVLGRQNESTSSSPR